MARILKSCFQATAPIPRGTRAWLAGLTLALVLFTQGFASAEPVGSYAFRSYTHADGLGNPSAFFLYEDSDGFIWIATEDGLFRYDGSYFQRFGEADGMPANVTRILHQDGAGKTWIGTIKGVARWDGQRFQRYGPNEGAPEKDVSDLSHGADGSIWAVLGDVPYRLGKDGRFALVPGWNFSICSALTPTPRAGRMWAASRNNETGISQVLSFEHETWRQWELEGASRAEPIGGIIEDAAGRVWARGRASLWVLQPGTTRFTLFASELPPGEQLTRLSLDLEGQLLLPTGAGVYRFVEDHLQPLGEREGLPSAWVRHALVDHEGSLWVGGSGVYRILGRGLWEAHQSKTGLPGEVVWSVIRDAAGRLWVGTNRGIAWADKATWHTVPGSEKYQIQSLLATPDGAILAASRGYVLRWDPHGKQLELFGGEAGVTSGNVFRAVLGPDNTVFIATATAGLRQAKLTPPLRFAPVELPLGTPDEMFIGAVVGPTGRVWAAGAKGLALLENGVWQRFTAAEGLLEDHTTMSLETRSGEILVAYLNARGVSRFRLEGKKLRLLEHPDQNTLAMFPRVYSLAEDKRGCVWLGTSLGMLVRGPWGEDAFTQRDGLPSDDINNMAFYEDAGGDVWIGTAGGLARFASGRYQGPPQAPRTALHSVALGARAFEPQTAPQVARADGTLSAQFSALTFAHEGRVEHQIWLSGVDSGWHATMSHEARYPALPPGDYVFQARSRIGNGGWGAPVTASFRVLPAWYETLWFRACGVLSGLALLALLVRLRLRALRRRNEELQHVVDERTSELRGVNDEMRLVLDNTGQGLGMLDLQGALSGECSAALVAWFGEPVPDEHFAAYLARDDADKQAQLRFGYEQAVSGILPLALSLDQMPKELVRGSRHFSLEFQPVLHAQELAGMLLVVSDVTSLVEASRADALQREQLKTFGRVTRDRPGFLEFFEESCALLDRIAEARFEETNEELRVVHTLTGNTALFDAHSVAGACRALEQALVDADAAQVVSARQTLISAWNAYATGVVTLLGPEHGDRVELELSELRQVISMVRERSPHREIERRLCGLVEGEPINVRLWRIGEQIRGLSQRLGKGEAAIHIESDDTRLSRTHYAALWSSFAHVVRNTVDHGFQASDERLAAGKASANQVALKGRVQQDRLLLEISDDGRGIDWNRVAERAKRDSLPHANRAALTEALFLPQFTTVEHVTEHSGRGIGMAAISEVCRALGGRVSIESTTGFGTHLYFDLPLVLAGEERLLDVSATLPKEPELQAVRRVTPAKS